MDDLLFFFFRGKGWINSLLFSSTSWYKRIRSSPIEVKVSFRRVYASCTNNWNIILLYFQNNWSWLSKLLNKHNKMGSNPSSRSYIKCSVCTSSSYGRCDHCRRRFCASHFRSHNCSGVGGYGPTTVRCKPECSSCNSDADGTCGGCKSQVCYSCFYSRHQKQCGSTYYRRWLAFLYSVFCLFYPLYKASLITTCVSRVLCR